jgi:RNA polymerase sigma-70 factor (ECF subfamily)
MAQDELYHQAATEFGAALERLARAYENDHDRRRDLVQDIHVALWRSLGGFDGRCSLRTWVYRVAHNTATTHAIRDRRHKSMQWLRLEALEDAPDPAPPPDQRLALDRLLDLVQRLEPHDRQVILLYLEGLDAASIAEVTGLTPSNVAVKVHRIKAALARRFHRRQSNGD